MRLHEKSLFQMNAHSRPTTFSLGKPIMKVHDHDGAPNAGALISSVFSLSSDAKSASRISPLDQVQ